MRRPPPQRPPSGEPRGVRHLLAALVAFALLVLVVWQWQTGAAPAPALGRLPAGLSPGALNLLLVTLDTTRPDRIRAFAPPGARVAATPHLDALAARGTLFSQAISTMPLTLAAHATMFTGLYPAAHGVRDNGGFRLAESHTTLAELLATAGWQTGGFVSAYVLDHKWGIAQGFERYRDDFDVASFKTVSMGEIQRRGDDTVAAANAWIEGAVRAPPTVPAGAPPPFFAWVHLYDPHAPYDAPEPFAGRYPGRPYDAEIAWTDSLVGNLLATLERLGVADRTVVAVIGDHGESLGEHGESGHGFFVYGPSVKVPFLLAGPYPTLSGRRVDEVVRQVDLLPTVLELLGVPSSVAPLPVGEPAREGAQPGASRWATIQGRSLVPLLSGAEPAAAGGPGEEGLGGRPGYAESFYPRFHYGWSELRSVRTSRWAFVEAPHPELYDLVADPGETRNVADEHRRVVVALREALSAIDASTPAAPAAAAPLEEDEETLRKLAALGYVGSLGNAGEGRSFRELPDPKDRLAVYNLMNRARELGRSEEPATAVPVLEEVLAQDPEVVDAWYLLGNVELRRRRLPEAAEHYRRALALRPDHDWAMIGLADTLVGLGRLDDAVLGYRRYLEQDPGNAQITYRLAQVLLDAGRGGEADPLFARTLELEPKTPRAEVGRAVAAALAHDLAAAHAALDRALVLDSKAQHARYNRAILLEGTGRAGEAVAAYRAELADHPTNYKAWFNLGRLLDRTGAPQGAAEALERAVTENPDFGVGRLFWAQSLLAAGDLAGATREARRGLELAAESPLAPLGHYVLADVFERQGRGAEAATELARGKALEAGAEAHRGPRSKQKVP